MKIKNQILPLLLFLILVTGCVSQPSTPPPTLRISGKSLDDIKGAFIAVYQQSEWQLQTESSSRIVFIKSNTDSLAMLMHSSRYDGRVFNRESVVFAKLGETIQVSVNQEIVSNQGSAFERSSPVPANINQRSRFEAVASLLGAGQVF